MGTEFAIANFPDIVTEYMQNKDIDTGGTYDNFLYPFAMQVPGLQHIVDWIVLEGTSKPTLFADGSRSRNLCYSISIAATTEVTSKTL